MYELHFLAPAERFLKKLRDKELFNRLKEILLNIQANPYQGEVKRGNLAGIYCVDLCYNKTNYEIAYRVYEDEQLVVVMLVGSRENFYDELKRIVRLM